MKKFSKVLALVLCFAVVACFASCGDNSKDPTNPATPTENGTAAGTEGTNTSFDFSKEGEYSKKNDTYVIGLTGPLTGSASQYGISVQRGAQIAVDEINAAGGLNGVKFSLNMKDDKATAADASTGYDALYEEGMQVSLCSVTSGSAESFASRADEDGVFSLTPSGSSDKVINASKYAFRVCFGDPDQGTLAAEELAKNYNNIGVIYDNSDAYSQGIYEAFKAEMAKLGKSYKEQTFDAENKRDFSTQAEALKDCDVIFLPIYYTEAGLIAKACAAKGCTALLFGCDGLDGVKEQIDSTVTAKIKYITPFDVNSTDTKVKTFVDEFKAKYSDTPDQFAADAYDGVYIIFNAMKTAGVNNVKVDPAVLGDALISVVASKDFSYTGVTGAMTWDASGACSKEPVIVELN